MVLSSAHDDAEINFNYGKKACQFDTIILRPIFVLSSVAFVLRYVLRQNKDWQLSTIISRHIFIFSACAIVLICVLSLMNWLS